MTDKARQILITGATGGIGSALVRYVLSHDPKATLWLVGRRADAMEQLVDSLGEDSTRVRPFTIDILQETDLQGMAETIQKEAQHLDMAIHTVGALSGPQLKAEKSLRDVTRDTLVESYSINTVSFLLLAKHVHRLFRHERASVFAAISAKVGSIADNQLGGWYSYRASKAALNMAVKNAALEYQRTGCKTTVLALHPGTTETTLSKPFLAGYPKDKLATPEKTAERLFKIIEESTPQQSGLFLDWDGTPLPW